VTAYSESPNLISEPGEEPVHAPVAEIFGEVADASIPAAVSMPEEPPVDAKAPRKSSFISKGFWAVTDQGLFAGSNAVLIWMLAIWLSPDDFGAFSTAFAAFLAVGVVHTAILTEPMLVFAPDRYRNNLKQYLGALLYGHIVVSIVFGILIAVAALVLQVQGQYAVAKALYCFAAASPFILFLWLMRRACYAQLNPRRAALSGFGYLVLMMSALFIVHQLHMLNFVSALAMLGGSSAVVGIYLSVGQMQVRGLPREFLKDVVMQHWRYGLWASATQVLGYIPGNIYYFLLPKMASLADSGALRAISNLFNPFVQANSALCLILLPTFVRTHGTPEGKRMHRLALLVLAGGPFIYWIILGVANHKIVDLVYHHQYLQYSSLIWIIGFQPVIAGMCGVYGSLLRAKQKMNAVFWGGVVAAVAAVTLGVAMTKWYGMAGVCWSIVITYGLHHITLWAFSRSYSKEKPSVA